MREREWLDVQSEALARAGRKKPRRRKMVVVVLEDDPAIRRSRNQKGRARTAERKPLMGDGLQYSEDAQYWNQVPRR